MSNMGLFDSGTRNTRKLLSGRSAIRQKAVPIHVEKAFVPADIYLAGISKS